MEGLMKLETSRSSELIWPSKGQESLGRTVYNRICKVRRRIARIRERKPSFSDGSGCTPVLSESCQVVDVDNAPAYLRRPFIYTGYLVGGSPLESAWHTLFGLNNETLNAWTMLPGCFAAIAGVIVASVYLPTELTVFWIFLLSALPHAPFSIRLHLTIGCSEEIRNLWRTLDIFFIFTCAVPRAAALGWYVFPEWRRYSTYMGLAATIYVWNLFSCMVRRRIKDMPKASLPKAMLSTILCYTTPVLFAAIEEMQRGESSELTQLYCAIFALVLLGGVAYAYKVPERWAPGCFDLIGNGHQVMHVAVAAEYMLELWFLWHMAHRKVAAGNFAAEEDTIITRLLDEALAAR